MHIVTAVADAVQKGERVALVTVVRVNGSAPQRVGAKLAVFADGSTVGTIGGGCYEHDAIGRALVALRDGARPFLVHYDLNDDFAQETGLVCGGQMDVFIEALLPDPALYIVGAGHVGQHLAHAAAATGFAVHVLDDREAFANRSRFPDAQSITVDDMPTWLSRAELPADAFVVIVTRGHRHDLEAVRALVSRPLRYLGLIGSKAKIARIAEQLTEQGVDASVLSRLHAPIGLDIGAITPQEIAISILAELIAVRHQRLHRDAEGRRDAAPRSLRWTPPSPSPPRPRA